MSRAGKYNIRTLRLKGGALYIAMMTSIITGVLISLFLLIGRYNQQETTISLQTVQLYHNLQSAFDMAQSDYFSRGLNNTWIKNSVNDDSVKIIRRLWGAYLLLTVFTKNRHQQLSQAGLYGTFMNGDTALFVADYGKPVNVSGQITLKAPCYLPKAGIKPVSVEGQSYNGAKQNDQFIKAEGLKLPEVQPQYLEDLKQQREPDNSDSLLPEITQALNRSFTKSTLTFKTPLTQLSGLALSNNIRIIADDVEIDSSCHFNNILLVCKKARFKDGFKGRLHVLASDSIIAGKNCEFSFPSSFVLFPENDDDLTSLRYITFDEGCRFWGGVLAVESENSDEGDLKQKVLIKAHPGSEINGLVYSSDYIHVQGQLNASLICSKLLIRTASAVYENQMLGCTIDPQKYAASLAVPLIFREKGKLLCCEKVN